MVYMIWSIFHEKNSLEAPISGLRLALQYGDFKFIYLQAKTYKVPKHFLRQIFIKYRLLLNFQMHYHGC